MSIIWVGPSPTKPERVAPRARSALPQCASHTPTGGGHRLPNPGPEHRDQSRPAGILSAAAYSLLATLVAGISHEGNTAEPDRSQALEEIIVSAELRATPWLEQATSSTIIDATLARKRVAAHLENLLQIAPNVNFASGSSRARFYQIRGIGERSQFVEPLNPSVGVLIDNIDFSGLATIAGTYDIEQVEILRGPQGTLHGANALAGLINLKSAAPTEELSGRVNALLGDFGRRELGLSLSGPIVGSNLLGRLAVFSHESDGFLNNSFLGRSDNNERDELTVRGKLNWRVAPQHVVNATMLYADVDNGYDAFSLDNTRSTLSDEPGRDRQESNALGLDYRFLGDKVELAVLGSVAVSDSEYSYDEDWSFVGIAPDLEYSSFDRYLRSRDSYSVQARVSSQEALFLPIGDLQWTAGVYALRDDEDLRREYTFASDDFGSRFRASTVAVFGQADLAINERLSVSAGLRLARRDMDYSDTQDVDADPSNDLWGGKLALQYFSDRAGMFYASISRGYRAGGVNAQILAFPSDANPTGVDIFAQRFFSDELLYNYEVGHKGRFADDRIQSSLALFFMDRTDQQVRGSLVIPRPDNSTAFVDFTDNAASGVNLGVEWELRVAANTRLDVYMNVGLLDTEFENYVNADGRSLDGRDQAQAPNWQFATGATYRISERILLDVQWEGKDAFFWSDRHDERSGSYSVVHGRLAYQTPNWEVALWGRNLADKDYFIRGFGSFGNDPRKGYVTEEYVQFGEPRHLGISFEYRM
ncbi:MAG: TonB-dependent receptor [Pseudomonadota bacterium]